MMPKQTSADDHSLSLDKVFADIRHWRNNKHEYEHRGIPDSIWRSIFTLEEQGYSKSELRQLFTLNSQQYNKKRAELFSTPVVQPSESARSTDNSQLSQKHVVPPFAEAVITNDNDKVDAPPLVSAANKTKQAIKQLKTTNNQPESYLDNATVIVECIRDDGHRLKIHLTTCRLDTLMQSFFNYGEVSA